MALARITSVELDAELCTRLHVLLLTPRLPVTNGLLRFDATCATYPVVLDPHHEEGVVLGELNRDFLQYKEKLDKVSWKTCTAFGCLFFGESDAKNQGRIEDGCRVKWLFVAASVEHRPSI